MTDRRLNIFQLFSLITPHQKHSALNAALPAHSNRLLDLLDLDSTIHRIENALGSAFRADPDAKAAQLGKQVKRLRVQPIRPGDALERDAQVARTHLRRIRPQPRMVDGEYIV